MGCGSTKTISKTTKTPSKIDRKLQYTDRAEQFEKLHFKFKQEIMNRTFSEALESLERNFRATSLDEDISKLYDQFQNEIRSSNIDRATFFNLVKELMSEKIIRRKLNYEEIDTFKVIKEAINKFTDITQDEKKSIFETLINKEGYYVRKQTGITYFTDKIHYDYLPLWKYVNNNLLYNKDLGITILTLVLTPSFFSSEDILEDLQNVIEFNELLTTVNIIICPLDHEGKWYERYHLNPHNYKYLYKIFEGVRNNPNIKVLLFNSMKDYQLVIPPEITDQLLEKMEEDTLLGIHIGKLNFSKDFESKFLESLTDTKNLLYLGIDLKFDDDDMKTMEQMLLKNRSLNAIVLAGFKNSEKNFEVELEENLKKIKNIVFCHYEKDIDLFAEKEKENETTRGF